MIYLAVVAVVLGKCRTIVACRVGIRDKNELLYLPEGIGIGNSIH